MPSLQPRQLGLGTDCTGGRPDGATGAAVTFDAGASGGAWGTNVAYAWTQSGGTTVALTGADSAMPTFSAPASAGELVLP